MYVISRIQDFGDRDSKTTPLFVCKDFKNAIEHCMRNPPADEDPKHYHPRVDGNKVFIYEDWDNCVFDYFEVVEVQEV